MTNEKKYKTAATRAIAMYDWYKKNTTSNVDLSPNTCEVILLAFAWLELETEKL